MNGRDVADAAVDKFRRELVVQLTDWAISELVAKRDRGEVLTQFEKILLSRLELLEEM